MPRHCTDQTITVQLRLESLEEESDVCLGVEARELPLCIVNWLRSVSLYEPAEKAVVARARGSVIGFVRWVDEEDFCTYLHGTYVRQGYRHLGLARAMWEAALPYFKGKIDVVTSSIGGEGLVQKLMKEHPEYEWFHDSNA